MCTERQWIACRNNRQDEGSPLFFFFLCTRAPQLRATNNAQRARAEDAAQIRRTHVSVSRATDFSCTNRVPISTRFARRGGEGRRYPISPTNLNIRRDERFIVARRGRHFRRAKVDFYDRYSLHLPHIVRPSLKFCSWSRLTTTLVKSVRLPRWCLRCENDFGSPEPITVARPNGRRRQMFRLRYDDFTDRDRRPLFILDLRGTRKILY